MTTKKAKRKASERAEHADMTGMSRLVENILFGWLAQLVFVAGGFLCPRLIDQRLGREQLGTWDFAWSFVSYFHFVQAGIGGAVSREIARLRIGKDVSGITRTVNSACFVLAASGIAVAGLSLLLAELMVPLSGKWLGERLHDAQWLVRLLGVCMAVEIAFSPVGGIITGCHLRKLDHIVTSGWHAVIIVGMILSLFLGGGLVSLGAVTLLGTVCTHVTKLLIAPHVCEGVQLKFSSVRMRTIKELYLWGLKSLIPVGGAMLLTQTSSVLIMAYLGPGILALYSRSRSLIQIVQKYLQIFAMTLTTTASALQAADDHDEIRELVVNSVRYAYYFALPIIATLTIFGGPIIGFWMGPDYGNVWVPAVLACGSLAAVAKQPAIKILAGLNAHGQPGIAELVASLCSIGAVFVVLAILKQNIIWVAVAATLPLAVMNGPYVSFCVCRRVGLNLRHFCWAATIRPVIYVLPLVACLVAARVIFRSRPLVGLLAGGTAGYVILAILYWRYVLPERLRDGVRRRLHITRVSLPQSEA